eukprot:gene4236-7573_t
MLFFRRNLKKDLVKNYSKFQKSDKRPKHVKEKILYEQELNKVRQVYKKEFLENKQKKDAASVEKFKKHREEVLNYRRQKSEVSRYNLQKNQEFMEFLTKERDRKRRERNQNRINQEMIKSTERVYNLQRMVKESQHYITKENIDEHLMKQLNPGRIVTPTIFKDRIGIIDEVNYYEYFTQAIEKDIDLPSLTPLTLSPKPILKNLIVKDEKEKLEKSKLYQEKYEQSIKGFEELRKTKFAGYDKKQLIAKIESSSGDLVWKP